MDPSETYMTLIAVYGMVLVLVVQFGTAISKASSSPARVLVRSGNR